MIGRCLSSGLSYCKTDKVTVDVMSPNLNFSENGLNWLTANSLVELPSPCSHQTPTISKPSLSLPSLFILASMAEDQPPLSTTPPITSEEDLPTPTATAVELPPTPTATTEAGEAEAQPETGEKVEEQKEEDEPVEEETTLPRQSLDIEGSDLEEKMNQVSLEDGWRTREREGGRGRDGVELARRRGRWDDRAHTSSLQKHTYPSIY